MTKRLSLGYPYYLVKSSGGRGGGGGGVGVGAPLLLALIRKNKRLQTPAFLLHTRVLSLLPGCIFTRARTFSSLYDH